MPGPLFPKKKQPKRAESLAIEPDRPMTNGSPSTPCLRLPNALTEDEARLYQRRLRAWPILVARTSTNPWVKSSEFDRIGRTETTRLPLWLPNYGRVGINATPSNLSPDLAASTTYIGLQLMSCTTTFGSKHPAIVIVVKSKSTSGDDDLRLALECKKCLENAGVTNVEVKVLERFFLTGAYDARGRRLFRSLMQSG